MTREEALVIKSELDKLTDTDKWKYLIGSSALPYVVFLDNSETYIELGHFEDEEVMVDFDNYIGWSDGIQTLLDELNIVYEVV